MVRSVNKNLFSFLAINLVFVEIFIKIAFIPDEFERFRENKHNISIYPVNTESRDIGGLICKLEVLD